MAQSPGHLARHGSMGSNSSLSPERSPRRTSMQLGDSSRPLMPQRQSSSTSAQDLINSLEAEEERLVLGLSKKLEQVRSDNVQLQSSLEKEQEALFNKLAQLKTQEQPSPIVPASPTIQPNFSHLISSADPLHPNEHTVNQALQAENTYLRESLASLIRDRERSSQNVDQYRSELIELRQRLGLDVGDLIGSSDPENGKRRLSQSQYGLRASVPAAPHNSFASFYHGSNRRGSSSFTVGSPPNFNSFGQASSPLTPSTPSTSISPSLTVNSTAQTTPGRPVQTIAELADQLRAETADGTLTPPRHLFVGSPAAYIKAPPPSAMTSGANSVSSSFSQSYLHDGDSDEFRAARSRSTSDSRGSSAKVGETGQFRRARGASGASADRAAAQRAVLSPPSEASTVEEDAVE